MPASFENLINKGSQVSASYNKPNLTKGSASKTNTRILKPRKFTNGTSLFAKRDKAVPERRDGPPLSGMFVGECLFQATSATVALFAKETCKGQVQIGIDSSQLHPQICNIDAEPGLYSVRESIF